MISLREKIIRTIKPAFAGSIRRHRNRTPFPMVLWSGHEYHGFNNVRHLTVTFGSKHTIRITMMRTTQVEHTVSNLSARYAVYQHVMSQMWQKTRKQMYVIYYFCMGETKGVIVRRQQGKCQSWTNCFMKWKFQNTDTEEFRRFDVDYMKAMDIFWCN